MLTARPDWLRWIRACCSLALGFTWFVCGLSFAAADSAADPDLMPTAVLDPYSPRAAYAPFLGSNTTLDDAIAVPADGYAWRGVPPARPDWRGVRRDTAYFLGHQFAVIAVLYVAPESISGWDSEKKDNYSFDKWRNNVSQPVWDEDLWWINYILHPYWGGTYYIRARERGLDRAQSFWFSALLSTLFEYGAEALAEPVSAQDLVVTPVAGFLVGEYLFSPLRQRIRAKPGKLDWSDKALLVITDPLGVLNAETDRLLGVKSTLQLHPVGMPDPALAAGLDHAAVYQLGPPHSLKPAWGVQLRIDW